jgi:uncharacterized membrane protein
MIAVALALFLLAAGIQAAARFERLPDWLDPVILAYAVGLILGNLGLGLDAKAPIGEGVLTAAVLLGIPLLLFPADFLGWLRLAPKTAASTGVVFLSVGLTAVLSGLFFAPRVGEEGWIVAGMLTGTYTGSAPNLVAVGKALGVDPETQIRVLATDFVVAGTFCFVLLSPAVKLLLRWLKPFEPAEEPVEDPAPGEEVLVGRPGWRDWGAAAALGLGAAAVAGGVALLLPKEFQELAAIFGVTALGVGASLSPRVRALRSSVVLGDYWILVFCLAFGSLADLSQLWGGLTWIFVWTVAVLVISVGLHWLLCRPLGIDRDTAVITTAAAIFGPALIAAVAANLENRELVLSGVTAALAGLALGSYLGVGISYAVRALAA